jgi:hypothetical protein
MQPVLDIMDRTRDFGVDHTVDGRFNISSYQIMTAGRSHEEPVRLRQTIIVGVHVPLTYRAGLFHLKGLDSSAALYLATRSIVAVVAWPYFERRHKQQLVET